MQYHFTTGALVGAVLAVMGNASPISHSTSSIAPSTPSFSPDYSSVVGKFTAVAAFAPTSTTAPSDTLDIFSGFPKNFGPGPVIFGDGHPDIVFPFSTVGTPRRTSVAASSTASSGFAGFHPHFGHGPVIPGRGFHHNSNGTANHTFPKTSASETHSSLPANTNTTSTPSLPFHPVHHLPNHPFHLPASRIDARIELSNLEHEIRVEKKKTDYFEKQFEQAETDVARVLRLLDPHHNATEISGTNLYLRVAKEQSSYAEEALKKAQDEMKKLEEAREHLIRRI
jgi:hypothetical protein